MTTPKLDAPTAVITVLVVLALVNVSQFWTLEEAVSDWYEAVKVKPGHELPELVADHFDSTRTRFELYLQLREVAPGANITVPADSEVVDEHLLGLAWADRVVRSDDVPVIDVAAEAALAPLVVAAGQDQDVGPYALVVPDAAPVDEVVLAQGPERAWFVERSLLAAARGGP